jgi:basic amino acid/polyamine antiporter, APA family
VLCFGALNGWVLLAGQLPLAIAADGLFPRVFASVSSRGVPARGMIIGSALSTALIAMNYSRGLVDLFTFIILLATLGTLVPYVFASLATFLATEQRGATRINEGNATVQHGSTRVNGDTATEQHGSTRFNGAAVVAALAFAYSLWAIGGAGAETVYWGFLLLFAGLPVYVWVRVKSKG